VSRRPGTVGVDSRPDQLSGATQKPDHPGQRLRSVSVHTLPAHSPSRCPNTHCQINVPVGEKVILNVISDTDDEVHAHIGGPGYELEVKAGTPAKGEFTIDSPGSFEVESHHLEKIIVILNAR
jgi:hypothetical protein